MLLSGRSHPGVMSVCSCQPVAVSIIRHGFWPSSPTNPTAIFSIELLKLLHMLTLECAVAVKGFVNALRWMNQLTNAEVS